MYAHAVRKYYKSVQNCQTPLPASESGCCPLELSVRAGDTCAWLRDFGPHAESSREAALRAETGGTGWPRALEQHPLTRLTAAVSRLQLQGPRWPPKSVPMAHHHLQLRPPP